MLDWNTETIAEFKRLYNLPGPPTFSEIAASLTSTFRQRFTRNACIGKALRMGWARRGHGLPRPTRPRPPKPPTSERRVELKRGTAKMLTRTSVYHKMASRYAILETEVVDLPDENIPAAQRRTLHQLTDQTCRWPIGEPGTADFFFCGAPADLSKGQPYCPCHARRAWRPRANISDDERERRSLQMTKLWRQRAAKRQLEKVA